MPETHADPSDGSLLESVQQGDIAAFGQLVRRHQSLVCAVAFSIVIDRAQSEDVAQDAFLALWESASSIRDPDRIRSWLCNTTRNLARRALRGRDLIVADEAAIESARDHETPFQELAASAPSGCGRRGCGRARAGGGRSPWRYVVAAPG
jgi:DNA-directed RNA polymerase specialized sigma24 family protein